MEWGGNRGGRIRCQDWGPKHAICVFGYPLEYRRVWFCALRAPSRAVLSPAMVTWQGHRAVILREFPLDDLDDCFRRQHLSEIWNHRPRKICVRVSHRTLASRAVVFGPYAIAHSRKAIPSACHGHVRHMAPTQRGGRVRIPSRKCRERGVENRMPRRQKTSRDGPARVRRALDVPGIGMVAAGGFEPPTKGL